MKSLLFVFISICLFAMCSRKNKTTKIVEEYKYGKCVMLIENDSIEVLLFVSDSSIILAPETPDMDPCKIITNPIEKRTHYHFCGYSMDFSDSSYVNIAKIKQTYLKDTTQLISANTSIGATKDIIKIDTLGKCRAELKKVIRFRTDIR
jgi:hypothetical protein